MVTIYSLPVLHNIKLIYYLYLKPLDDHDMLFFAARLNKTLLAVYHSWFLTSDTLQVMVC